LLRLIDPRPENEKKVSGRGAIALLKAEQAFETGELKL
jgi:hypothetical protein